MKRLIKKIFSKLIPATLALTIGMGIFAMPFCAQDGETLAAGSQAVLENTSDRYSLEISYGYGDSAKGGRYLPVSVNITSMDNVDFTGQISFLTRQSDENVYEYSYPMHIKAGKTGHGNYNIPLGIGADQIYVMLVDNDKKRVLSKRIKLNVNSSTADLFIGILCDEPDKLLYLDDTTINYGLLKTRTFTLTSDTFPEEEIGLDLLDVILISDYRIRNLNVVQSRALMDWVKSGGVLILGTGDRVDDTLGRFAPELLDDMYDDPELIEVDMASGQNMEVPGDNMVSVSCVYVPLHGGNIVIPNDELPLVTSTNRENGIIAVAAFDFVDISEYAFNHNTFVDNLLTKILTSSRMETIASEVYGSNSGQFWPVQSLINTAVPGKMPNMTLYLLVIIIYIVIIGPVLYFFLRRYGLNLLYRRGVLMLSIVFTAIVYIIGFKTRFRDTFYSYAAIEDTSEDTVKQSIYMCLQNPYNRPYSVGIKPYYSVLPITRPVSEGGITSLTGEEENTVQLDYAIDDINLSVSDGLSFNPKYFRLDRSTDNTEGNGFTGQISLFGDELTGEVTNNYDYKVVDAFLLFYGKVVMIGDLNPGETKDISGLNVINIPLGNSYTVANMITGLSSQNLKKDTVQYLNLFQITNLISFYEDNYLKGYTADARLIGFADKPAQQDFFLDDKPDSAGVTLLTSMLSVDSKSADEVYRNALMKNPTVKSGDYYVNSNSVYSGEPVVVEYSLGDDLDIMSLKFENISEEVLKADDSGQVNVFSGTISFYNNSTGNYDNQELIPGEFDRDTIIKYLSPDNVISVRYACDNRIAASPEIVLPMITIIGKER